MRPQSLRIKKMKRRLADLDELIESGVSLGGRLRYGLPLPAPLQNQKQLFQIPIQPAQLIGGIFGCISDP